MGAISETLGVFDALPVEVDVVIWRASEGNYAALIAALCDDDGNPIPMDDATVGSLTVFDDVGSILEKTTADTGLTIDLAAAEISWIPTFQEAALIRLGRLDRYRLDVTFSDGSSGPVLVGYLIGKGLP